MRYGLQLAVVIFNLVIVEISTNSDYSTPAYNA